MQTNRLGSGRENGVRASGRRTDMSQRDGECATEPVWTMRSPFGDRAADCTLTSSVGAGKSDMWLQIGETRVRRPLKGDFVLLLPK